MNLSLEQLEKQASQLFDERNYTEIITLLNDAILETFNDASLYAWKARAYGKNSQFDLNYKYAQFAIDVNPLSKMGYFARGNAWANQKDYQKAIEDYNLAISIDENYNAALINRGYCYYHLKEYDKAIVDFTLTITIDNKSNEAYIKRGQSYFQKKELLEALKDFNKAISLSSDPFYFNWRGSAWFVLGDYAKAYKDYNHAKILKPKYTDPYYNIGLIRLNQKRYNEAIKNLSIAIEIDSQYLKAYNLRANAYNELGSNQEALNDYLSYVNLETDNNSFTLKLAKKQINELRKKIENLWYNEIDRTIKKIKTLLLFDNICLTHFTSLSAAKAMILDQSLFRLSEGNFLNDTSEGRELFKYLDFFISKTSPDDTIAEVYVERPFIGSFVADNKHDDLTLWRMYGKEAQLEAKGCALTINREEFIKNLEASLNPQLVEIDSELVNNFTFSFYKVAYREKDKFNIPNGKENYGKKLNALMVQLKKQINSLKLEQKVSVTKLLNDIAYLFKSSDYQYENEVRLVVPGIGFKKVIAKELNPPRVYIEVINIIPVIQKITLGPKVERPDEWAAAFNYQIEQQIPNREEKVEIVISHLPFK